MAIFAVADQFTNYYEYHQNKFNQAIHFVFVPVILFSFIMLLSLVGLPFLPPTSFANQFISNLAFVLVVPLSIYYLLLDRAAGVRYYDSILTQ